MLVEMGRVKPAKPIFWQANHLPKQGICTTPHPTITSSNSDSGKPHATLHDHLTFNANISTYLHPSIRTVAPGNSGDDLFLRANTFPCERESVTHRIDCNTVGPVLVASGYGSSMLTHSAAYMLRDNDQNGDNGLRELSETQVGVPETSDCVDNINLGVLRDPTTGLQTTCCTSSEPTRGFYATEGVAKITHFTDSTVSVMPKEKSRGTSKFIALTPPHLSLLYCLIPHISIIIVCSLISTLGPFRSILIDQFVPL